MKKVIHYCWFGGKPLPKMAKKCIRSWKKYLPEYEIKQWDESNFDVNICPFVKEAYEKKKWAFVSDYARIYALYKEGGIYFDTDMEVKKNIDFLLDKEIFMGKEDSGYFATAVIGVKEKENRHIKEIIDFYNKFEHFDENRVYEYANPIIITNIFKKYDMKLTKEKIEIYDNCIYIYPRDYFCPLSYNYQNNEFTDNTCMIHYFNGTWTPKNEQFIIKLHRKFGKKWGNRIYNFLHIFSNIKNKWIYKFKYRKDKILMWGSIHLHIDKRIEKLKNELEKNQNEYYVAIHHPEWIGVTNSTKDNFKCTVPLREIHTEKEAQKIAEVLVKSNKKMIIFNAFAFGWENIAKSIKKIDNSIIIKVLWHGSHALLSEYYDERAFKILMELYKDNIIDEIGFVKKSLYEFYKRKGYNVSFIMNTVNINNPEQYKNNSRRDDKKIRIGLYSSGDRWVKNSYNQISAISLVDNAVMDAVPLSDNVANFAKIFNIEYTGERKSIKREEMLKRIANNDVNVYVTFTECAPLIPLESLELGVPCITGDNHHYFEGTKLEKYLVVSKEDNIIEIYNQIMRALQNKDEILKEYKLWKKDYDLLAKKSVENFLQLK